jgi:phosphoglycerate dehydrogenase-like enzyme
VVLAAFGGPRFEQRGKMTVQRRKRAIGTGSRRTGGAELHIHLLNAPDIAAYWFAPDRLRAQITKALKPRRPVRVTVSADPADVPPEMRGAQVLVGFDLPTRRIAELPDLRWIHLVSAGVNHLLPLDWLPPSVTLTNSSGVHAELAGQYGAAALLALNFRMPAHVTNQGRGRWDQVFNSPIGGKTVVLVGLGAIGGSVARQAKRLGLRVLGVRRSRRPHPHADRVVGPGDLARVLPRADFVVVTAPLTPETRHILGAKELDCLKPGAGVVNMSRAGLVDYAALVRKLEAGELGGAIVDVLDPEPFPAGDPLWRTANLLITPHISSDPVDYVERMARIFLDNLARLIAGRPLENRVQPDRGY